MFEECFSYIYVDHSRFPRTLAMKKLPTLLSVLAVDFISWVIQLLECVATILMLFG